jgi:hypothetical protein
LLFDRPIISLSFLLIADRIVSAIIRNEAPRMGRIDEEVIEASLAGARPQEYFGPLLRRFFPVYCALAALVTFGYALYDHFQLDGDAVAYMDIGDNLRAHDWAGVVNAYWHPMYPAFLSLGHMLFHATLANELRAYYFVNFAIFLLGMLAVVCFTDALLRLRDSRANASNPSYLLNHYPLRYLGIALVVISSQRELSLGKVRPDALLQAFLLLAVAALLTHLATNRLRYAAFLGLALGCAYLTKSFAFVFAFLCILTLAIFRWFWLKHSLTRILAAAALALITFGVVAGPYVAALSRQHGRLDFGDSGALNYAWYVGGTEKMHLQPYQTSQFGSADVHLKHPEREVLHSPLILSYAQHPYGTYPDWFDTTYWNDQIKPHFKLSDDVPRATRNLVLVTRYLFNHPEALILLALLILLGSRLTLPWGLSVARPGNPFWLVPLFLGVTIWVIYALVNTEERYVTIAYLAIILTLFATLRLPSSETPTLRPTVSALVLVLALLSIGESLRTVLEDRRQLSAAGALESWYMPVQEQAAQALAHMGVQPGDTVACVGYKACLSDFYWARLAHVRILTEIYNPTTPNAVFFANLPNQDEVIDTVRAQGVKVLVGDFDNVPPSLNLPPQALSAQAPTAQGWHRLGGTTLYALPLNLPPGPIPHWVPPSDPRKPSI